MSGSFGISLGPESDDIESAFTIGGSFTRMGLGGYAIQRGGTARNTDRGKHGVSGD
jgi:hypothetical protein